MRRFRLQTIVGVTAGERGPIPLHKCVATGVVFYDGTTVVRWLGENSSTAIHASIAAAQSVHHVIPRDQIEVGQRHIAWEDPICFACGARLELGEIEARHCYGCGAGQARTLGEMHYEDAPDPTLGAWAPAILLAKDEQ